MLLGIAVMKIAEGAGEAARPRTIAATVAQSTAMSIYNRARDKLRANDRQEQTRDFRDFTVVDPRTPLSRLPIHTGDGAVSSWVLAEGWSETAWMSAVNTIPEGEWR